MQEGATVIIDSTLVKDIKEVEGQKIYRVPITETAKKEAGREMTANIVALGVIVGITGVVSEEAIKEAVLDRIPAGTEEMNIKALSAGLKAGKS